MNNELRMKKSLYYSKGQVILIILLVTVVGLTIGLSLVSRTIEDVRTSSQISESQKAFSAAESGIEAALSGSDFTSTPVTLNLSGGSANYSVSELGGSDDPFAIGTVAKGQSYTVWLIDHEADGTLSFNPPDEVYSGRLDVCWAEGSSGEKPAMELTLLYYSSGSYKIGKAAYDPDYVANGNNFNPAGSGDGSAECKYSASIDNWNTIFGADAAGPDTLVALRVKPVYHDANIQIRPFADLPSQGKQISSTGTTTAGVARKINVLQGYSSLPSLFDYTLFTQ